MPMKIFKIKEWIQNKGKKIQFHVVNGPYQVERILDGERFLVGQQKCDDNFEVRITKFHEDQIHVLIHYRFYDSPVLVVFVEINSIILLPRSNVIRMINNKDIKAHRAKIIGIPGWS